MLLIACHVFLVYINQVLVKIHASIVRLDLISLRQVKVFVYNVLLDFTAMIPVSLLAFDALLEDIVREVVMKDLLAVHFVLWDYTRVYLVQLSVWNVHWAVLVQPMEQLPVILVLLARIIHLLVLQFVLFAIRVSLQTLMEVSVVRIALLVLQLLITALRVVQLVHWVNIKNKVDNQHVNHVLKVVLPYYKLLLVVEHVVLVPLPIPQALQSVIHALRVSIVTNHQHLHV